MQPYSIEPLLEDEGLPKPKWKRRLAWGVGCGVLLLALGAWAVTSELFMRTFVLSKLSDSLNAEIEYKSAEWSPTRELVLHDLTIRAKGEKPCLTAKRFRVGYIWRDLWEGRMEFGAIEIDQPVFTVTVDEKGRSNLGPLFDRKKSGGKPTPVWTSEFKVQNGRLDYIRQIPGGGEERLAISHLEIRSAGLGTGRSGKLNLAAGVQYALRRANAATVDVFNGTVTAESEQNLHLDGTPISLSAKAKLAIQKSTGQFEFAGGLEVDLLGDITGAGLKELRLKFGRGGKILGSLTAKGELDVQTGAGKLELIANQIDRGMLNFAGSPWGLDFHGTVLNSTNLITLADFSEFVVTGSARAAPMHLSRHRVPYPSLDSAGFEYSFNANISGKRITVYRCNVGAAHRGKKILNANLNDFVTFAWGADQSADQQGRFQVNLYDADLADWRPWLGQYATEGAASGSVMVDVRDAGRDISINASAEIDGLQIPLGESRRTIGEFRFKSKGRLTDYQSLKLTGLDARAGENASPDFRFKGDAAYDLRQRSLSATGVLEGELPVLLQWFPQPKLTATSGHAKLDGVLAVSRKSQSFSGTVELSNVTGRAQQIAFTNLASQAEAKLNLSDNQLLRIDTIAGRASLGGDVLAEKMDVTGDWNVRTGAADFKGIFIETLDLGVLRKSVALPGLEQGKVDADLVVVHAPGKLTTLAGSVSIANTTLPHLPANLNATATDLDLALAWDEEGHFTSNLKKFKLQLADAKNQPLASLAGNGKCDPLAGTFSVTLEPGEISHPILRSLLVTPFNDAEITAGKLANPKPVNISRDATGAFHFAGLMRLRGLALGGKALDGDVNLDVRFRGGEEWMVSAKESTGAFRIGDQPAGTINVSGAFDAKTGEGQLTVAVAKVDHTVVGLLPKTWLAGLQMTAGTVSEIKIDGAIREGIFDGNVNMALDGARLADPSGWVPEGVMDIRHSMSGRVSLGQQRVFQLTKNAGTISRAGKVVGEYDLPGSWVAPALFLDVKKLRLEPLLTEHFLARWLPNRRLRAGTFEVSPSEVRLNGDGSGRFAGIVSFKNFALAGVAGAKDTPLNASFEVEAMAAANRVFQLRQFIAHLPVSARAANQATFTGTLDLSQPTAPTGELVLKSDAIDLTALTEIFREQNGAAKPKADGSGLAFRKFILKTDVKKVFWRELSATGVRGELHLDGRLVKVHPLEMRLLGAPLMIDGWVIPNGANTQFGFQLSCEGLPLTPVARQFHPALPQLADYGELTLHTHVRADAIRGDKLRRTLQIRGIEGAAQNLAIRSAVLGRRKPGKDAEDFFDIFSLIGIPLAPVDAVTGGIFSAFLTFMIDDLQKAFISDLELQLHVEDGVVQHRLSARGTDMGYDTEGKIRLAANWRESPLDQKISIFLAGKHSRKLRITGGLLVDDDKLYPLVEAIPLKGTLAKPELDTTALVKIALGTMRILGKPAETIEGILGLPGKLFDGLGIFD